MKEGKFTITITVQKDPPPILPPGTITLGGGDYYSIKVEAFGEEETVNRYETTPVIDGIFTSSSEAFQKILVSLGMRFDNIKAFT